MSPSLTSDRVSTRETGNRDHPPPPCPVAELGPISWPEIVVLHLGPGGLAMIFLLIVAPILWVAGYPPDLAEELGVSGVAAAARLGYLAYAGHRRGVRASIRAAVAPWWKRMPIWQFAGLYLVLAAFGLGLYFAYSPVEHFLADRLFFWLPAYLHPTWDATREGFGRGPLLLWGIVLLVMDGFVNPVIEELYFRGHLLPRMIPGLGWKAPIVSAAGFALQHFWQPFNAPFLFLFWLVAGPAVVWKRNLALGIALHVTSNVFGAALVLVAIFGR